MSDGRGRVLRGDDRRLARDKVQVDKRELRAICIRRGTTLNEFLLAVFGHQDRSRLQQSLTRGWMRRGEAGILAERLEVDVKTFTVG